MIFIKTIIIQFKYRTPKIQNALDPKRLQNKKKNKRIKVLNSKIAEAEITKLYFFKAFHNCNIL